MVCLSFVVAVQLAALAAAMSVSVDSNCAVYCGETADCCGGSRCVLVYEGISSGGDVSMSTFHPGFNSMTHWHGRLNTCINVWPSELQ
ncbi:hypothetical protein EDB19DRAFT_1721979 [Suillus lakei]|nr:hypothetical protein EDB19DRAFT_1721979 [Suillus lakei]